jgi:hypothetical protein
MARRWPHQPSIDLDLAGMHFEAISPPSGEGRLSESLLAAFEDLTATIEPVQTILHGPVADQSSLHGLLDRIQWLGLEMDRSMREHGMPPRPSDRLVATAEPHRALWLRKGSGTH